MSQIDNMLNHFMLFYILVQHKFKAIIVNWKKCQLLGF